MAALSSTSLLRRPPSHMMAGVATAIAEEMAANPATVPAAVYEKARNWSPELTAGIHILGHDTHAAGWRRGRLPGVRDAIGTYHPVFDRIMVRARRHEGIVTADREAALRMPATKADLWQAAIYRWSLWFGVKCDLGQVYRDSDGRLADDQAYTGRAYDADHAPDELLRQVLDVSMIDWISLLETLRATWPEMFGAVWHRDAAAVDRLSRQNPRFPDMLFLRVRKNLAKRLCAVVAIFWEAERLLELMHAIGGPRRATMTRLATALASTSLLGIAVAADDLTGRYIGSMWCHRGALALLFDDGLAIGHDPRHPHRSFGPGGDAAITDEINGCVSDPALESAGFNVRAAAPFTLDSRLRDVRGEEAVTFFAGHDVRGLAIRFLLDVRSWLGSSQGRKAGLGQPLFEIETDGAIGRLALLMIARICPDTAHSILREAVDAMIIIRKTPQYRAKNADDPSEVAKTVTLGDVVANPRLWHALPGEAASEGSVATQSRWLGKDFLGGMVRTARKDGRQFIVADPATLGHTACFIPGVWFEPYRETATLQAAWENVGVDHETAFPGCFDRSIPADELDFCLRVAARQQVSATDMLRDPHCRQPDCIRSPKRGLAANKSDIPPPAPQTASQRLLLARVMATAKGASVKRPFSIR